MNRPLARTMLIALSLACAATVEAGALVNVQSTDPALVFLDGHLMGSAPMQIRHVPHGRHMVEVRRRATGERRLYQVWSPPHRMMIENVVAQFPQAVYVQPVAVCEPAPVCAPAPETVVVQPVAGATIVQPVVVAEDAPPVNTVVVRQAEADRAAREEREKVRTRNTLLGAAAANEIFNRGNSKGVLRGVTLGGALLNEILH